jgi:hypothetical protein
MGPLKAPGPDGFSARFFQWNWEVLRVDITRSVRQIFISGKMPAKANETSIVLIPKTEKSELLKDYRRISLCNVIYKIVSKCLINRLRPLLEEIITLSQSAFILGRMITDNALIVFECLHANRSVNCRNKRFGAFKLDLTKAYDRVD